MATETPVPIPSEVMPGRNGGFLRRGGGRVPAKEKAQTIEFFRSHSVEVAQALVRKALKGDTRAIELILSYAIGKPVEKLELTGEDGGPVAFIQGWADHEREALRDAIDAEIAARQQGDSGPPLLEEGAAVAGPRS